MSHVNGVTLRSPESRIPLLLEAETGDLDLCSWISANRMMIDQKLLEYGALLFRGFGLRGEDDFPRVLDGLCDQTLSYVYRSTPRSQVSDKVYTATEYPAHKSIPFHNEEAYTLDWPMRLVLFCALPAQKGGETPIADTVRVTARIAPEIVERFSRRRVMYVRNYGMGVDLDWQTVFQTQEKTEVDRYCQEHDIEVEWRSNGCLRTRQVCQAVAEHPKTGQVIWFNQAHLFHVSSLDEKTRLSMLSVFSESDLPRNTYYGDGSAIEDEVLANIRAAFEAERVQLPWQVNDVMLLDNMLVSHARNPFQGKRRVLVGMGDAYSAVASRRLEMPA